jgi:hypothetical protein
MVLVIKKGMTKEEIDELLKQLPPSPILPEMGNKKPIDATKYLGKIRFDVRDIIEIQRRMRDDRNYSY